MRAVLVSLPNRAAGALAGMVDSRGAGRCSRRYSRSVLLAGSRRTGSAYDRFARVQRVRRRRCGGVVQGRRERVLRRDRVGSRPSSACAQRSAAFPRSIETLDGHSIQPDSMDACYSGPGDVETLFDASGRFGTTINRSRFVAGRAARPDAADEVVISRETADRLDLGPGDGLQVRLFGGGDCMDGQAKWRACRNASESWACSCARARSALRRVSTSSGSTSRLRSCAGRAKSPTERIISSRGFDRVRPPTHCEPRPTRPDTNSRLS